MREMPAKRIALVRVDGEQVCADCEVASTPLARMRGLLGRSSLDEHAGVLFPRTRSVHTHFMRFPIDVVFLDGDREVVKIVSALYPWRVASCRRSRLVLELSAGRAARVGLREGDRLLERRAG